MTRVAAYCRVSTDKMDQINSFNSQKAFFIEYIHSRPDWQLSQIYADEGITGTTTTDRAGFLQMIDDAMHRSFDIVLTKEVSRFSRNILDAIAYTRKLKEAGVGVIFLNDGISTLEPDAELRLGIMAAVAQEESRKTSERVRWGQTRKMENGVVFGRSLLGYDVINGKIYIEPQGAETVQRIFNLYVNDRLGVRAIAKTLSVEKISTKTGRTDWSGAAILKILRNEKYCGDLVQKKTITGDYLTHKKQKNKDSCITIRDHHKPIIDRVVWDAAQNELRRRSRSSGKTESGANRYALSGKITCAGCGGTYLCRTRKRRNGSLYRTWSCPRCTCQTRHKQLREEVVVCCARHITSSYNVEKLLNGFEDIIRAMLTEGGKIKGECEKNIALTEIKKLKLIDAYLTGAVEREEFTVLKTHYEAELDKHRLFLAQLQSSNQNAVMAEITETAISLASGCDTDDGFYLSLLERVEVMNNACFEILMSNSVGKWSVEF